MSGTEDHRAGLPFAAILWDLDGTLVDSEPVHQRSFVDAARSFGLSLPGDFHTTLIGQSEDAIHRLLVADYGLDADFTRWSDRRFAAYLARIEEVTPFDLSADIWQMAAALGLAQAIVSNSPRGILDANMTRMGLAPGAVVTVSRNDVTRGKPHPDPYLCALDRLALPARSAVVVEDSGSGLAAARAAGLPVFMMPAEHGPTPGDWTPVEDLHRLLSQALRG